jgi:hypothetical protein
MDAPHLLVPIAFLVLLIVLPPLAYQAIGRTGDVMAQLFVPPDQALGWPHGIQESDEPWGWRPGPNLSDPSDPQWAGGGGDEPAVFEVVDLGDSSTLDGLVIEVGPVPRERPHRAAA